MPYFASSIPLMSVGPLTTGCHVPASKPEPAPITRRVFPRHPIPPHAAVEAALMMKIATLELEIERLKTALAEAAAPPPESAV